MSVTLFWPVCPADERHPELNQDGHSEEQKKRNYRHHRTRIIATTWWERPPLVGATLHRDALFWGTSGAGG